MSPGVLANYNYRPANLTCRQQLREVADKAHQERDTAIEQRLATEARCVELEAVVEAANAQITKLNEEVCVHGGF